jgi:hypothetical protein
MPFFGSPVRFQPRSLTSVLIVEPVLGLDASQPSVDAPLGSTPSSDNFVMREGGLEPRPTLVLRNTSPQPMANIPILGGWEIADVTNLRYPLISGTTRLAWFSAGSWSALSYVSAGGVNSAPAGSNTSMWDATQVYYDLRDQNIAVLANGSYQSLYCWQSNTTVFSSLTGAPQAKYVAAFDNYLVAFNIRDAGSGTSDYVQRVQWGDRGSASSWTGGLSGFEDLLDMRGQGTRVLAQENRLVLFSDAEVWQGVTSDFPFVFRFYPLDRSVGCPYGFTAVNTPLGIIFLARNLQTYLLPKAGGAATPIGQRIHRTIRDTIDVPERAWAVYDPNTDQYQLYHAIQGGSGRPQRAMYLNLQDGTWAPQSFDRVGGALSLTRGFAVTGLTTSSSATTWGGLGAATVRWADLSMSWAALGGLTGGQDARAVYIGSSNGTMYELSSTATSDNGTGVESRWRSTGLQGFEPDAQKTVTEFRVDYQADSASSLTVRFSQNAGSSFEAGRRINLPVVSSISQAIDYPRLGARYPMFEVTSEAQRYRLFRFYVKMRRGGR